MTNKLHQTLDFEVDGCQYKASLDGQVYWANEDGWLRWTEFLGRWTDMRCRGPYNNTTVLLTPAAISLATVKTWE